MKRHTGTLMVSETIKCETANEIDLGIVTVDRASIRRRGFSIVGTVGRRQHRKLASESPA